MKRRIVATLLATMLMATPVFANTSAWAKGTVVEYLGSAYKEDLDYTVISTREEFAELCAISLSRLGYAFNEPQKNPFKDTTNDRVIKMTSAGLLSGTSATTFDPKGHITREQMATIMIRLYDKQGIPLTKTRSFNVKDAGKVSDWALQSVKKAYEAGLILGDGDLYNPKTKISREQSVVIISRSENEMGKKPVVQEKPVEMPPSQTIESAEYDYSPITGTLYVKANTTFDAKTQNTPGYFDTVIVKEGAEATFVGIPLRNAIVETGGTINLIDSTTGTVKLSGTLNSDGQSAVEKVSTSGTAVVNSAKVVEIDTSTGTKLSITGNVGKLNVNSTINTDIQSDTKIEEVNLKAKTTLTTRGNATVVRLNVNPAATGSVLTLSSAPNYLMIGAECTINGETYKAGEILTMKTDKGAVSEAVKELTYEVILGKNTKKDKVTSDLVLPTKIKEATIEWNISEKDSVSSSGRVTRAKKNVEVKLEAKITKGSESGNRSFVITVEGTDTDVDTGKTDDISKELIADLSKLELPASFTKAITLSTVSHSGHRLTYTVLPSTAAIMSSVSGGISITPVPTNSAQQVRIIATITSGTTTRNRELYTYIPGVSGPGPNPNPNPLPNPEPGEGDKNLVQETLNEMYFPESIISVTTFPQTVKGIQINYVTSSPDIVKISGNQITPTRTGSAIITANAGPDAFRIFTIKTTVVDKIDYGAEMETILNGLNPSNPLTSMTIKNEYERSVSYLSLIEVTAGSQAVKVTNIGGETVLAAREISRDTNVEIKVTLQTEDGTHLKSREYTTRVKAMVPKLTVIDNSEIWELLRETEADFKFDKDPGTLTLKVFDASQETTLINVSITPILEGSSYVYRGEHRMARPAILGHYRIELRDSEGDVLHTNTEMIVNL